MAPILLAFAVAFVLLAVSLIVLAFAASWRISWWEWQVLMLLAFGLIALAARREWHEERRDVLEVTHSRAPEQRQDLVRRQLLQREDGGRSVTVRLTDTDI